MGRNLLEKNLQNFTDANAHAKTILHAACAHGASSIVKYLVEEMDCGDLLTVWTADVSPLGMAVEGLTYEILEYA